jgi:hypothetical protein
LAFDKNLSGVNMKTLTTITLLVLLLSNIRQQLKPPPPPCVNTGYTKIAYGTGVTSCGDTIKIVEYHQKPYPK